MRRIGLALGGGGVRGLAHIGILRTLERHAIRPAIICGTSSGAIIGLAYAAGMTVDEMDEICRTLRWRRLIRPSVRRGRVFDTERFDQFLATIIDARDFDDLDYVCAAVACDSATKEPVLLARGDPVRAARASSALRGIFSPIEIDGRRLVDGAVVEALPVSAARHLGADYVIGVTVFDRPQPPCRRALVTGDKPRWSSTNAYRAASEPDRHLRPLLDGFSPWNFAHTAELVQLGERAAEDALSLIRSDLAGLPVPDGT